MVHDQSRINRRELIKHLRGQFQIDWFGHHGVPHWARVRVNGLMLASETGANPHVTELFAFFHDSRRFNEHVDDGHGQRGAELACQLKGRFFEATDDEMDLLSFACTHHSGGLSQGNLTVMSCWDSDRLDLGRVGITPDPRYLCTAVAKDPEVIARAHGRAKAWQRVHAHRSY